MVHTERPSSPFWRCRRDSLVVRCMWKVLSFLASKSIVYIKGDGHRLRFGGGFKELTGITHQNVLP